jgi:hypothetical protein
MPSSSKPSSSERRRRQADRIDELGRIMVRSCDRCVAQKLVCRVHIGSGRCGACTRSNSSGCNVRVTEHEWARLRERRKALEEKREQNRWAVVRKQEELVQRMAELTKAQEELSAAWSKDSRLQKEMDQLEQKEAEALSVEEAELDAAEPSGSSVDLALQPSSWSLSDNILDDFWSDPQFLNVPEVVSGGSAPLSGSWEAPGPPAVTRA